MGLVSLGLELGSALREIEGGGELGLRIRHFSESRQLRVPGFFGNRLQALTSLSPILGCHSCIEI